LLDAIRGVALGGILLGNLMSFLGADMLAPPERRAMAGGALGERVLFGINWLVEGKFYSIFSILLGTGFALQAARAASGHAAPGRFNSLFRRRMLVLSGIGLLHMYLVWAGDILALYGVIGLTLPTLWRLSPRTRMATMLLLFLVPIATHALILASDGRADPRVPFAGVGAEMQQQFGIAGRPRLDVFAGGGAREYWAWNVSYAVTRPGTYLQSGRPAKVLALFLLGAWIGATLLPTLTSRRHLLVITAVVGGALGLSASYVYALIKAASGSSFLLSTEGLLQTTAYTAGTTPLALAYLAAAAIAWQTRGGRAMLGWFEPLGRMALSVYVTQSMVQAGLFSGIGLGLAGRVPIVFLPSIAAVLLVCQRYACAAWLRRHQHGPLEWIWRRATYGGAAPSP
jgi:uncharacterized protein